MDLLGYLREIHGNPAEVDLPTTQVTGSRALSRDINSIADNLDQFGINSYFENEQGNSTKDLLTLLASDKRSDPKVQKAIKELAFDNIVNEELYNKFSKATPEEVGLYLNNLNSVQNKLADRANETFYQTAAKSLPAGFRAEDSDIILDSFNNSDRNYNEAKELAKKLGRENSISGRSYTDANGDLVDISRLNAIDRAIKDGDNSTLAKLVTGVDNGIWDNYTIGKTMLSAIKKAAKNGVELSPQQLADVYKRFAAHSGNENKTLDGFFFGGDSGNFEKATASLGEISGDQVDAIEQARRNADRARNYINSGSNFLSLLRKTGGDTNFNTRGLLNDVLTDPNSVAYSEDLADGINKTKVDRLFSNAVKDYPDISQDVKDRFLRIGNNNVDPDFVNNAVINQGLSPLSAQHQKEDILKNNLINPNTGTITIPRELLELLDKYPDSEKAQDIKRIIQSLQEQNIPIDIE